VALSCNANGSKGSPADLASRQVLHQKTTAGQQNMKADSLSVTDTFKHTAWQQ
jgi:hypothetical protein